MTRKVLDRRRLPALLARALDADYRLTVSALIYWCAATILGGVFPRFGATAAPGQVLHAGGQQADDGACLTCHGAGQLAPIVDRHLPAVDALPPVEAAIQSITNTGPSFADTCKSRALAPSWGYKPVVSKSRPTNSCVSANLLRASLAAVISVIIL